jgi:hypothetical protein
MFDLSRLFIRPAVFCSLLIAVVLTPRLGAAQSPSIDHSSFNGGWVLNKDASTSTPAGLVGRGDGSDAPPRGARGGAAGRGRGGFGGGRGGFGGAGGYGGRSSSVDPRKMEQMMALRQEVLETPTHWIVTQGDGTITFVDADGQSRKFLTSNKKEKHQLQNGTIETKTRWDGALLQQEITGPDSLKILRTFDVSPDGRQLVVTSQFERSLDGRQSPPMRIVYDADPATR